MFGRVSLWVLLCTMAFSGVGVAEEPADAAAAPALADAPEVSFGVDYTIASDYLWRGMNFSEYDGEGGEDLNHQLDVSASMETSVGVFGAGIWFEWFAGQDEVDPGSSGPLQEVDYYFSYGNAVGPVSVEVGWILYTFPQTTGSSNTTHEVYASLGLDDSVLFGSEEAILNPSVTWYVDLDDNRYNSWFEIGVSHDFAMADLADCGESFTVTPSLTLGVDHRFTTGSTTRLANLQYGLDVGYDLSAAMEIPEEYGSVSLTGFVAYSQAFADDVIDDEFWGGVTLSWAK